MSMPLLENKRGGQQEFCSVGRLVVNDKGYFPKLEIKEDTKSLAQGSGFTTEVSNNGQTVRMVGFKPLPVAERFVRAAACVGQPIANASKKDERLFIAKGYERSTSPNLISLGLSIFGGIISTDGLDMEFESNQRIWSSAVTENIILSQYFFQLCDNPNITDHFVTKGLSDKFGVILRCLSQLIIPPRYNDSITTDHCYSNLNRYC